MARINGGSGVIELRMKDSQLTVGAFTAAWGRNPMKPMRERHEWRNLRKKVLTTWLNRITTTRIQAGAFSKPIVILNCLSANKKSN
jgi:hypothetical protein